MLKEQKNKMNMKILEMLRNKGAPSLSPFPGEQEFESEDLDLDNIGDVTIAGEVNDLEEKKTSRGRIRRRKGEKEPGSDEGDK